MIKQPNMRLIGLFIVISLTSLFLMLAYFLKSNFSSNDTAIVMFFDESVNGLDVGSPVFFKGVKIGEVTSVKLKASLQTKKFVIPVYAKLYGDKSMDNDNDDKRELLNQFIKDGLRAKLVVNSMITGQLSIELDLYPDAPVVLHPEDAGNLYEIPTIDSPFEELYKSLQDMPISKIVQDIHGITQTLDKQLPTLLTQLNTTMETLNLVLSDNKGDTSSMLKQIKQATSNMGDAAKSFNNFVNENSSSISTLIESFSQAAISLKNLTDYLQMNPSSIITGKEY